MTAAEIRAMSVHNYGAEKFTAQMLQEIAAQLAEFNERCEKNCIPQERPVKVPFGQREIATR